MIDVNITINQPVEKVWDLFMDPHNLQYWLTGFVTGEHISGNPGETGSVSKLKFFEGGKEIEVTETILLVKPYQQYKIEMNHKTFDVETDIRFISLGQQTEMIQTVHFSPRGFLMKLMMPLAKGEMKKRTANELLRFKNFVERKAEH